MKQGRATVVVGPCETPEALRKHISTLAGLNPLGLIVAGPLDQNALEMLSSKVGVPMLPYTGDAGEVAVQNLRFD